MIPASQVWLPRLLYLATFVYCLAAINFSWIQGLHDSDTILPALISIDSYRPFYWSENRFGMLVPLLAVPIRDYAWNLLFQTGLTVASLFLFLYLVHALDWAKERHFAILRMTLTGSLLTLIFSRNSVYQLLLISAHTTSLCITLVGLYHLARSNTKGRLAVAFAAFFLAFWINGSLVVLATAAAFIWPHRRIKRRIKRACVPFSMGVLAAAFASFYPGDARGLAPLSEWFIGFIQLLSHSKGYLRPEVALIVGSGGLLCFVLRRPFHYRATDAIAIGCVLQIFATCALGWVAKNEYNGRYILAPILLLFAILSQSLLDPLFSWLTQRRALEAYSNLAGCAIAIAAVTLIFGVPSVTASKVELAKVGSARQSQIGQLGCTHLLGDYWFVWSSVFHDRLVYGTKRLWGVTFRAEETRAQWDSIPSKQRRYCSLCADPLREYLRSELRVAPLVKTGSSGDLCTFAENSPMLQ